MLSSVWADTFLNIVQNGQAGKSPFDNETDVEYGFMRFGNDNLGSLFVWDSKNRKKGIIHRIPIPDGAVEIDPQNEFLSDYQLV